MPSASAPLARLVSGDPEHPAVPRPDRFAHVIRLAQHLFDVPMAAVNLVDAEGQRTVACVGLDGKEMAREDSFCAYAVDRDSSLVISDMRLDERFGRNRFVAGDPGVRFYAGEPLHGADGEPIGTLCVLDSRPRELGAVQVRLLRDLADWVERELVHDEESEQAQRIQRGLLPRAPLRVPGYDLAGDCRPARNVGGDYFDWLALPDGTMQVLLADVMGKGMEGAVVAAGLRAIVRGASRFITLERVLSRIENFLDEDRDEAPAFVTLFGARLTPRTGELEYVDAGHGLALVVSPDGVPRRLTASDPPIGIVTDTTWTVGHDRLEPGETLLVVSDGVLDVFPDVASALTAGVDLAAHAASAQEIVDTVTNLGGATPLDDITAMALRRDAS